MMCKRFKSIVSAIMAVLMLISISIPAMATEQIDEVSNMQTLLQDSETDVIATRRLGENEFKLSGVYLTEDRLVGGITITSGKYVIQHKLTGKLLSGTINKWVNFRIIHMTTGESRTFTAVSTGEWISNTYLNVITPGPYQIWVINTARDGNYDFEMKVI